MRNVRGRISIICMCILTIFSCQQLLAQDALRKQLFSEADELLAKAREVKAEFFAPVSFGKAMRYYDQATEDFAGGRMPEDIRERTKNAAVYFAKAIDASKRGETTLRSTMVARTDASTAGALRSSLELWNKAEDKFLRAARKLEDGDETGSHRDASEAETLYRTAELEAIKANFLSPARDLLKQADDLHVKDNARMTLQRSQRLVMLVEALLRQNRYDTDSARDFAQEARYEATHAIYLHQLIAGLKRQDMSFEDILIEAEVQFQRVAGGLGIRARFDKGFDGPVAEVNAAIKARDQKILKDADTVHQLADMIRQKDNEIDNLKQQVGAMQTRLGSLTEAEQKLQQAGKELEQRLLLSRAQENTIRRVAAMFTDEEGNLLREGDNIILRLYGLSFPSGRSAIEAQYYPLLSKVQDVIKKFPNCKVMIEGHTDSQGPDDANQTLSESRAKAVAEYLMANMSVQLPINSTGFGESRPIASNDTPEGRAKNRRIDVVITPAWAQAAK